MQLDDALQQVDRQIAYPPDLAEPKRERLTAKVRYMALQPNLPLQ